MKIAVTSQNRKTITGHGGKCRKFWIYEIDGRNNIANKTLLELALEQTFHESHGAGAHPLDGTDVLICGGAGQGLIRRLDKMGIKGLVTPETDPDTAVAAYLDGTLRLGQAESHEGHGDHHHGHH
ncbi:MAG: nitrogen fixation protein [Gammaproteobacteria bacterium]|nr:nitrogen fixation protein [Gammaproteobacteria bacterium]MBU1481026.1 nitrogen fixation protein [Gammaproteobacteria bacterium]